MCANPSPSRLNSSMTKDMEKLRSRLDKICQPYCTSDWCILKEMVLHTHDNLRTFVQLKLIEIFQWNMSQRESRKVEWDEASMRWYDSGMAMKFSEFYSEDVDIKELYEKIESACNPFVK